MSTTIASQRPAKVVLAVKLLYIIVAVGIIRKTMVVIHHADVRSPEFLIFISLVLFAVSLVLIYHTSKGKNWARWSLVVILLLSLPLSILPMFQAISHTPIPNLLGLIQLILYLVSLVLLFNTNSSTWFRTTEISKGE